MVELFGEFLWIGFWPLVLITKWTAFYPNWDQLKYLSCNNSTWQKVYKNRMRKVGHHRSNFSKRMNKLLKTASNAERREGGTANNLLPHTKLQPTELWFFILQCIIIIIFMKGVIDKSSSVSGNAKSKEKSDRRFDYLCVYVCVYWCIGRTETNEPSTRQPVFSGIWTDSR